jgi:ATP-binding cassette subfamily B protein
MASVPESLRTLWVFARCGFEADRRLASIVLALNVLDYGTFAIQALGIRNLTDAAIAGDTGHAAVAVVLLTISFVLQYLAQSASLVFQQQVRERTTLLLDTRLAELTARIPTVEHLERPDYLKELDLLSQQHGMLADVQYSLFLNLGILARVAISVVLLARVDAALLLLPLVGIPAIVRGVWSQRRSLKMQEALAERWRLHWALHTLATTAAPGMELRVFGLGDEVVRRYGRVRAEDDAIQDHNARVNAAASMAAWAVFALGFAAAVWFVATRALTGRATVGDVALAIAITTQLGASLAGLVQLGSWLTNTLKTAGRYLWLLDYAGDVARAEASSRQPAPVRLDRGIRLDHVTFRYHGTDADVLTDVTLDLPAGATVAVVGENGAGKTTLVKLLCRFYRPTAGRILVDDADLAGVEVESWRARLSASFQDFARLELLARETVGVGDLALIDDRVAVAGALDRAAAADLPAQLPAGLETQLGRSFEGGAQLSGGQWQKLAMGRAMMRPLPLLMVLDEPTAAIDAQTEHALFERYAAAARRVAAANGGITVLVSHRFSTVRMADLIVVLAGGRVVELGSHDELMRAAGPYAELYELQARAYR